MNTETSVTRVYAQLRDMAADFAFKPGERINETALSRTLNASRTPLREALNRLTAEGLLEFRSGKGFFSRALRPDDVFNLYETRAAIECEALRLGISRADDATLAKLAKEFADSEEEYQITQDPLRLLALDEAFHMSLCGLSGNSEMTRTLSNLNARIRFVRLVDLAKLIQKGASRDAHREILDNVLIRDNAVAVAQLRDHIEMRRSQATETVRDAFARLYVEG